MTRFFWPDLSADLKYAFRRVGLPSNCTRHLASQSSSRAQCPVAFHVAHRPPVGGFQCVQCVLVGFSRTAGKSGKAASYFFPTPTEVQVVCLRINTMGEEPWDVNVTRACFCTQAISTRARARVRIETQNVHTQLGHTSSNKASSLTSLRFHVRHQAEGRRSPPNRRMSETSKHQLSYTGLLHFSPWLHRCQLLVLQADEGEFVLVHASRWELINWCKSTPRNWQLAYNLGRIAARVWYLTLWGGLLQSLEGSRDKCIPSWIWVQPVGCDFPRVSWPKGPRQQRASRVSYSQRWAHAEHMMRSFLDGLRCKL